MGFLSNSDFLSLGALTIATKLGMTTYMWQVGLETPVTDLWCVSPMAALLAAVVLCRLAAAQDWAAIYESHWARTWSIGRAPSGNGLLTILS